MTREILISWSSVVRHAEHLGGSLTFPLPGLQLRYCRSGSVRHCGSQVSIDIVCHSYQHPQEVGQDNEDKSGEGNEDHHMQDEPLVW